MSMAVLEDESPPQTSGAEGTGTDRELLTRFLAGNEEAFAALVRRHTALVLAVCRRILQKREDAEDAYQSTFLVLAVKARSLTWQDSIAGWLHETARRAAVKLRSQRARKQAVQQRVAQQQGVHEAAPTLDPASPLVLQELGATLDREVAALPAKFREVILLCLVEGLTRDEAAERLGVTLQTVKDRLERGRELLRSRLVRRGLTLTSAMLAAWLVPGTTSASSGALTMTTAEAACAFAAGSVAVGTSPTAATLAYGVMHMMTVEKLKFAVVCLLSFLSAGGLAYGVLQDEPTRFQKGICGRVVTVDMDQTPTVTISLDDSETLLNLDIAEQARVFTAFEAGPLADLKIGQFVSLRLAADHRTVNEIHIQGQVREASIQSVTPAGQLVVVNEDDDDGALPRSTEVQLAPAAILRIGGLPAGPSDLKPGMSVPLEFAPDGRLVNAIELEAREESLVEGSLVRVDAGSNHVVILQEEDDSGSSREQTFALATDSKIVVGDKPAKVADLLPGSSVTLRLADDGREVRALKAEVPEQETEDDADAGQ